MQDVFLMLVFRSGSLLYVFPLLVCVNTSILSNREMLCSIPLIVQLLSAIKTSRTWSDHSHLSEFFDSVMH